MSYHKFVHTFYIFWVLATYLQIFSPNLLSLHPDVSTAVQTFLMWGGPICLVFPLLSVLFKPKKVCAHQGLGSFPAIICQSQVLYLNLSPILGLFLYGVIKGIISLSCSLWAAESIQFSQTIYWSFYPSFIMCPWHLYWKHWTVNVWVYFWVLYPNSFVFLLLCQYNAVLVTITL